MYATFHHYPHGLLPAFAGLLQVRTPQDFDYLIKESEVLLSRPGRLFLIASADRLRFRVHLEPLGYWVDQLDAADRPTAGRLLLPPELLASCLGQALAEGCLFTPQVVA